MDKKDQLDILENHLFKNCAENKTGTVYISTSNNKSCQIAITEGQVVACKMGRLKGIESLLEMKKVGIKGASFSKMQLEYSNESKIDSSEKVLKALGYVEQKSELVTESIVDTAITTEKDNGVEAETSDDLDYSNVFDFLDDPDELES